MSIKLDKWTAKQIELMEEGGNMKLKAFFDKYDLNPVEINVKYKTKAADYYRRKLDAESSQEVFEEE